MEKTGAALNRITAIFNIWSGNLNNEEFAAVETEMSPKLAEIDDKITQNNALFKRIEKVYTASKTSKSTPVQKRLAWRYYSNFVRFGAKLNGTQKTQLSGINQKLAGLFTKFSQNLPKKLTRMTSTTRVQVQEGRVVGQLVQEQVLLQVLL